jgi:hypothetical protein
MSNSNSVRQLNYPFGQKIIARNPAYCPSINTEEVSSSNKPFSRKPISQNFQKSLQNIKVIEKDGDRSFM